MGYIVLKKMQSCPILNQPEELEEGLLQVDSILNN